MCTQVCAAVAMRIAVTHVPRQLLANSLLPSELSARRSGEGAGSLSVLACPVRSMRSTALAVGSAAQSVCPSREMASPDTKSEAGRSGCWDSVPSPATVNTCTVAPAPPAT